MGLSYLTCLYFYSFMCKTVAISSSEKSLTRSKKFFILYKIIRTVEYNPEEYCQKIRAKISPSHVYLGECLRKFRTIVLILESSYMIKHVVVTSQETHCILITIASRLMLFGKSSCLHRASLISKTLFISPTDAHSYTNHRISKTV